MSEAYLPAPVRRNVRECAAGYCEYCLLAEVDAFFRHEADHIIAAKHGGVSTPDTLALTCMDCNRFKGSDIASQDTISVGLVPLIHSRTY